MRRPLAALAAGARALGPWLVLLPCLLLAPGLALGQGPAPSDPRRWSAADIRQHADEYAWRLFIALERGNGPAVWERWMTARQVYRADGADPGPWSPSREPSGPATQVRFESFSLKDFPRARHVVNGRMVDLVEPTAGARRLTEIRLDRTSYEFIRSRELYNVDGQLRAAQRAPSVQAVAFPHGATEVKAKWRVIGESERPRYHSLLVTRADGSRQLYGLTALAIASKVLPRWFWATFEHVDNSTLADGEGWKLPSRDRYACAADRPDCNRSPRGLGLEGSVWAYYRLRGTQTEFVDAAGEPQRLANSELERGFQTSASCMTCHARASIAAPGPGVGGAAGPAVRLSIFDASAAAANADPLARRGYAGLPEAAWFSSPGPGAPSMRALDFVWSLSQAQPRAKPTPDVSAR